MRHVLVFALSAAAASAAPASGLSLDVPFVHQRPDFCGEAVASMALQRLGRPASQEDVFDASGLDPVQGRGVWTNELATALRAYGVEPGATWYRVDPSKPSQLEDQWAALRDDLKAGQPSIVCMHYDDSPKTTEHFRLVTGYDAATDEVLYQEPAESAGANQRMPRRQFMALWPFKPARDRWTIIRLRLTPSGPGKPQAPPMGPRPADVAQHVLELKKTLPKDMTVVYVAPFLVIGNESPAAVRDRAKNLVRWTRDLLLADFFKEIPNDIEEIWVLKDAPTYQKYSRELFHTEPDTPYGYYLPSRRAQVMNIRPGGGTLVHEMVHPFMHHAWPEAPGWVNEGLASLFEFPYEEKGHLKGRVNWRLPALQAGLRQHHVPSFNALAHTTPNEFYDDPYGVNYAAARYLCHWLQQKGLLVTFITRAIEQQASDPSGWSALRETLGQDPDELRPEWDRYVLGLSQR